jgi:hypothetical protein
LRRWVLIWHRRLGLTSLALVMILALTGLTLNHTDALRLDERPISSRALLNWYGLKPVERPESYTAAGRYISYAGGSVYLDDQIIAESPEAIIGAAPVAGGIAFATPSSLTLIDSDDLVAKRLDASQLPGSVRAIARSQSGGLIIRTPAAVYSSQSLDLWQLTQEQAVWSQAVVLPAQFSETLMQGFRAQNLPLSRVLLDLHSGRIFGTWGPLLMDAAAIFLVLLSLSGFYNWYATRKK